MNTQFYNELELFLPQSSAEQRRRWAATILENNIDVKELAPLLKGDPKIATRFLWLLSELGTLNPNRLLAEQMDKHSKDYKKRVAKIVMEMETARHVNK